MTTNPKASSAGRSAGFALAAIFNFVAAAWFFSVGPDPKAWFFFCVGVGFVAAILFSELARREPARSGANAHDSSRSEPQ